MSNANPQRITLYASLALALLACQPPTTAPDEGSGQTQANMDTGAKPAWGDLLAPPIADRRPVSDSYHDVEVEDGYRWLEDGDDAEVKRWRVGQTAHAQAVLQSMPVLAELRPRVAEIMNAATVSHWDPQPRPTGVFMLRHQPPAPQASLVLLDSIDAPESARVLVDPAALDGGGLTHIDWVRPSPNGKLVAVSLSKGGSESGDVHVFDVATGELLEAPIPRVNGGTAGGDLAWTADGKRFFYTRYPRSGERPDPELGKYVQVHVHTLGKTEDPHVFGADLPDIAEIQLTAEPKGAHLLATVQFGDSGRFAHYLRDRKGKWAQLSEFGDGVVQVSFGGKSLWFVDNGEASPRGQLLRAPISKPDKREVFVAQGEDTLTASFWGDRSVEVLGDRVYALYQLGGPSQVRVFDRRSGQPLSSPEQPAVGTVSGLIPMGDNGLTPRGGGDLMFGAGSYLEPFAWFVHAADGSTHKTPLAEASVVDMSNIEVRREFATSKDGTKVPINILMPKGMELDGSNPCVVTGYGGYGVSLTPGHSPALAALLERGFCYAIANLRGGSEYGDAWHRAGALTHKQNVFDDFTAVLEYMSAHGYTRPERLGIMGGSNGGLLMGAALTQHPELFRAVVARVGIYDMLRVELSANGQYNIPEYGTVTDADQFAALHAYSPYHHVVDGAAYPDILFTTGANDPRVDPLQSRKMTARLQAATEGASLVLLRTSNDAGHGSGTPLAARIEERAEIYAFLVDRLTGE